VIVFLSFSHRHLVILCSGLINNELLLFIFTENSPISENRSFGQQ
jgi:hypothetical protein